MKKRGFKVAKGFEDKGINLPKRATKAAAGYDFEAAEDIVIPSKLLEIIKTLSQLATHKITLDEFSEAIKTLTFKPTLVPTGVKAYMGEDEYLQLCNRSSNPMKNFLLMSNGVGVIDADYYENESNDGHIMFQFLNFGLTDKVIKKGERVGQGIFLPFLKSDNDSDNEMAERTGGFGSSGK